MCICRLKKGESVSLAKFCWTSLEIGREDNGEYYLTAWGDDRTDRKINYCPLCGRELSAKDE